MLCSCCTHSVPKYIGDHPECEDRNVFSADYSDREGGRKDRQSTTRMSNVHDNDDDNREYPVDSFL